MSDTPRSPISPIMLDDLARDPGRAADLPPGARQAIVLTCSAIIAACAASTDEPPVSPVRETDRVLLIEEAASLLGMTKDFLYRNWSTLHLGYKDVDGHLKFPLSKVQRYIRTRT